MAEFMNEINQLSDMTTRLTLMEGVIAIFLSFILSVIITFFYKLTYRGARYSKSFVHTIIIMSVVVSVIMIVIGNNIAVAFGLVGAFSIIRFRSAMSDPKDIAFIFFGMAAGIACGLGFYVLAVIFTLSLCFLIYLLFAIDYGAKEADERTLRITVPENLHYEGLFDELLAQYTEFSQLKQVETTNLGTMLQLEYSIVRKKDVTDKEIIDAIREKNANLKVSINVANTNY